MAGPNILNFDSKVAFLGGIPLTLPVAATDPGSASNGDVYYNSTSGMIRFYNGTTWANVSSGGTVTSIGLVEGSEGGSQTIFTISSSPVTANGNISLSLASQVGNLFLASPNGSTGQPFYRAISASDLPGTITSNTSGTAANITATSNSTLTTLPSLTLPGAQVSGNISGNAANVTGIVAIANGGTGAATTSQNFAFIGPTSGSGAPSYRALVIGDLSFAGTANGVATLNGSGKIPTSQLPSNVFLYQGTWNPSTNTPILVDGTGTAGFVYWSSAAFAGPISGLNNPSMVNFQVGDLVLYNGTQWELTTPAAGVSSVNSSQGAVVLSVASGNGFAGTYSSTALTISTTITGILQGNGTAISAATTTGTGSVVLSASPTLTGTVNAAAVTLSGALTTNSILSTAALTINANSGASAVNFQTSSVGRSTNGTNFVTETYTDTTSLTDNVSTTTAFQFAYASTAGEELSYVIESGDANQDCRVGTLRVTANNSGTIAPSVSDMFVETADCGVTWSAVISGSNVLIQYTTTNQGAARTMRADIKSFRR